MLIARRSAVAERIRVLNQLQALTATAPIALRERIGRGIGKQRSGLRGVRYVVRSGGYLTDIRPAESSVAKRSRLVSKSRHAEACRAERSALNA